MKKYVKVVATSFVRSQVSSDVKKRLKDIVEAANAIINLYPQDCKQGLYEFSRIIPMNNHFNWKFRCPIVKVTPQNSKYLVSDYVIRAKGEIPYLKRWFPKNAPVKGEFGERVDVIVYNREQLAKEGTKINADYGIVAINVELKKAAPIAPQTMINNQMGIEFGGNGAKLNRKEYLKSIAFWKTHAFKVR